jgi:hypothetical protein
MLKNLPLTSFLFNSDLAISASLSKENSAKAYAPL